MKTTQLPIRLIACTLLAASVASFGCATSARSPYDPVTEQTRDPRKADELTQRALGVLPDDQIKAELLLREALTADLYHAPAHNNLGVLYLDQGRLYEAANEFEWARKLLPGHPDPRLNLGLTLERAGRVDDALAAYDAALEAYPEHLHTTKALARAQLRHGRVDSRTPRLLQVIAARSSELAWRNWATEQQRRLDR